MGQETEKNERRSEGADHRAGPAGNMFKYFGKTVQREKKKWKNTEKAENNNVRRTWTGRELTPKQMQDVPRLL